jgi:hypothetical protein
MTQLIVAFRNFANWPGKRSVCVLKLTSIWCVGIRIRRQNFHDIYSIKIAQTKLVIAAHDKCTLWRVEVYDYQ